MASLDSITYLVVILHANALLSDFITELGGVLRDHTGMSIVIVATKIAKEGLILFHHELHTILLGLLKASSKNMTPSTCSPILKLQWISWINDTKPHEVVELFLSKLSWFDRGLDK